MCSAAWRASARYGRTIPSMNVWYAPNLSTANVNARNGTIERMLKQVEGGGANGELIFDEPTDRRVGEPADAEERGLGPGGLGGVGVPDLH